MKNNTRIEVGRRPVVIGMSILFLLGLVAGLLLSGTITGIARGQSAGTQPPVQPSAEGALCGNETNVIQVAKAAGPEVVSVLNMASPGAGKPVERQGLGSGFIVSKDGMIVTNAHVVEGSSRVDVVLAGGKTVTAKVLGADPRIEIAILRIPEDNLPTVAFGDSDKLEVGQQAIAVGNPFGFERTVTTGVVSALNRVIPGGGASLRELIETDADINPGNSGGPLMDSCGRVVGVNSAVVSSGAGGGLGFAIPINIVRRAMSDVAATGRIIVPWIGIAYTEVTEELATMYKLPVSYGLLVGPVSPNSPASKADIRKGDIIISLNGKKLTDASQLQELIRSAKVGSEVKLTVQRGGKELTKTVTLTEMPRELTLKG